MNQSVLLGCFLLVAAGAGQAQPLVAEPVAAATEIRAAARESVYPLGTDDQIAIHALHVPEISEKPLRIDSDGFIRLPLVGRMKAAGLTTGQLEEAVRKQLQVYVEEPEVSIDLVEQQSQPVSVLGAVKNPGVHQLHGQKSLVEVLSLAGGIESDAGYSVRVSRRLEEGALPLPNAQLDPTGKFSVADVSLPEVMDGKFAAGSLTVRPHDVISVPRAKMVYVIGEVRKSGGFVLRERETMTVLQAVALAEGLNRTAGAKGVRILRPQAAGADRLEIPVNLSSILDGKTSDVALQPDDILFVPNSASKSAAIRTLETALQVGTGLVIWRR